MLFWNRWNHESAGRVYFNISGEKPAHTARHAARSTALVQTWMDRSETLLRLVHTRRQVVATCRGDTLQRQIASCVLENSVAETKIFTKINSPVHTKRFVAATCRLTLLLQLAARPVHIEWSVAATCCWNQSETILLQGSPELLISLLHMRRRDLGRDWVSISLWHSVNSFPLWIKKWQYSHHVSYEINKMTGACEKNGQKGLTEVSAPLFRWY